MGRTSAFDNAELGRLLVRQRHVITRQQALGCGLSEGAIRHRLRPDGPWQPLVPGIYLAATGAPTRKQREMAAFLYAGDVIGLTGPAALAYHAIPCHPEGHVDVLVRVGCLRQDAGFVRLHRTSVVPERLFQDGPVRVVLPARAIADTARQLTDLSAVRAVVAAGVQRGKVTVAELAEVADGIRSSAEGDMRLLIKRERLPEPMYNARLFIGTELIAIADAWWQEACLAAEVDSRQWHLSPGDWEQTLARHDRMTAHGIMVLHFPPRRIKVASRAVAAEIRAALAASAGRDMPPIRALPS